MVEVIHCYCAHERQLQVSVCVDTTWEGVVSLEGNLAWQTPTTHTRYDQLARRVHQPNIIWQSFQTLPYTPIGQQVTSYRFYFALQLLT